MVETRLILGDCLEVMKTIPSGSIDAIVTDPPYGENIGSMGFTTNIHGGVALRNDYKGLAEWDKAVDWGYFTEMFRVSKRQLVFGGNFYTLPPSRCWLIWDKKDSGKYSNDFADVEMAWTSLNAPARLIRYIWHGMIQQNMKGKETRYHPTQKPIAVMIRAIEMITKPNDLVFDPFLGSGSTGIACVITGRRFIGCE